jgi:small subunit ribosomal protein S16
MHIKIRFMASKNTSLQCCRIVASNIRRPRDGKSLENLGIYNKHKKSIILNRNRFGYWLSVGAIPTKSLTRILGVLGELPYTYKTYEFNQKTHD